MSWIGITACIALILILGALIAAYTRGYKQGFKDGEESGRVLQSLEDLDDV